MYDVVPSVPYLSSEASALMQCDLFHNVDYTHLLPPTRSLICGGYRYGAERYGELRPRGLAEAPSFALSRRVSSVVQFGGSVTAIHASM